MDKFPTSGRVRVAVILVQVGIVAGLIVWLKVCLPAVEKSRAAAAAAENDRRVEDFIRSMVADDASLTAPAGSEREHPQKLRSTPSIDEVERVLGAPQARSTDFAGGEHLTWTGSSHQIQASFSRGKLYSLRIEDRATGHGQMVFESGLYWNRF